MYVAMTANWWKISVWLLLYNNKEGYVGNRFHLESFCRIFSSWILIFCLFSLAWDHMEMNTWKCHSFHKSYASAKTFVCCFAYRNKKGEFVMVWPPLDPRRTLPLLEVERIIHTHPRSVVAVSSHLGIPVWILHQGLWTGSFFRISREWLHTVLDWPRRPDSWEQEVQYFGRQIHFSRENGWKFWTSG